MNNERRRYRNTWKDVTIYRYIDINIDINNSVDINNNRQETWGRADYK